MPLHCGFSCRSALGHFVSKFEVLLSASFHKLRWSLGHCSRVPLQALSVADGCRDAAALMLDGSSCPLSELTAMWGRSGHGERAFQRCHVAAKWFLGIVGRYPCF